MEDGPRPPAASAALPVTVIMPAYNRPAMTRRAVLSAFAQQPLAPAEVLVIDDCSTDDTAVAAREAGARVIRHEVNRGEGAARNTALRHASHEWVALLDSDDEWLPNHLHSLWHERHGRVMVAGTAVRRRPDGSHRLMGSATGRRIDIRSPADIAVLRFITASAVMLRRDVALAVGAFRALPHAADLDLWFRVLERGPGCVSPVVSVVYHEHPGQVTLAGIDILDAARDVLLQYMDRPWMTPRVLEGWDSVVAWHEFQSARARGDRRLALQRLRNLLLPPRRLSDLGRLLAWRFRERRRSARFTAEGGPSVAAMTTDVHTARQVGERFGSEPRLVVRGRPGAYWELARRPAAVLVAENAIDAAVARALGMRSERW
jgi:glycosyltransferase involved in cell wall biosynthesis